MITACNQQREAVMVGAINPFGVRMPPELKQWLGQRAKESGRSLNSEIVQRLKDSQKRDQPTEDAQQ
jgi:predicted HicB family RNase H-like nuclease